MAGERGLEKLLIARGLVSRPMVEHVAELRRRAYRERPSGALLVDLGYVGEEPLADALVELTGLPRWDGRAPEPATLRATEAARTPSAIALYQDGTTLHVATSEPDEPGVEALRLAAGARRVAPWVATRTEIVALRARDAPDPLRPLLEPGPETEREDRLARCVGLACIETFALPHGAFRLVVSDGGATFLDHGPNLGRRLPLASRDGAWIHEHLMRMAECDPDALVAKQWISFMVGGRAHDLALFVDVTPHAKTAWVEHWTHPLLLPSAHTPTPAPVRAAWAALPHYRDRGGRERALTELAELAAVDDPRCVHDHLFATFELAETFIATGRFAQGAALAGRALSVADSWAPAARVLFEPLCFRSLPRRARADAWTAYAARQRRWPLAHADALCEALGCLDPDADAARIFRLADEVIALEEGALTGRSARSVWACMRAVEAHALQGDANTEALAAEAIELARAIRGDAGPASADRIAGVIRIAQGRSEEARPLLQRALGAYARLGYDHARWATAIDLARAELDCGRANHAAELARGALASAALDLESCEDAEELLRQTSATKQPYR